MGEGARDPNTARLWQITFGAGVIGLGTGFAFWDAIEAGGGMGWVDVSSMNACPGAGLYCR